MEGAGVSIFESNPFALTQDCTVESQYTYDSDKISIENGKCALKTLDQTDNDHTASGFGAATGTGVAWDNAGHLKLGDLNSCDGSLTNCSSIDASWTPKYSSLLGHWKLDETSGTFTDYSGRGNNISPFSGALGGTVTSVAGKLNKGIRFSYSSYAYSASAQSLFESHLSNSFTYSLWVKPTSSRNTTPESNSGVSGTNSQSYAVYPVCGWGWTRGDTACIGISAGTNGISVYEHAAGHMPSPLVYDMSITDWTHVVVVYDNRTPKLYVNGVLVRSGQTSTKAYTIPSSYLGDGTAAWNGNYGAFLGDIDEFAVWSVKLSDDEISHLHARQAAARSGYFQSRIMNAGAPFKWDQLKFSGQNTIKYQVRSCTLSNCSDGSWIGSDGTGNTYFTSADQSFSVPDAQYFQYRAVLENPLSSSPDATLSKVEIFPIHYPTGPETIFQQTPLTVNSLKSISADASCSQGVGFSASTDGQNWKYWNGSSWASSDGSTPQTNNLVSLNQGIRAWSGTTVYLRSHLKSDGTTKCELSSIGFSGER